MTIYYLYVKTHEITGLKYLGQTKSNPYEYEGSGITWVQHLKEHGKFIKTEIIKECNTKQELKYWGKYYSKLWNVVESNEWANRVIEAGGGGWWLYGEKNPQKRLEVRQKTSLGVKRYLAENPTAGWTLEKRKKHSDWNRNYWTEERRKKHLGGKLTANTVCVTDLNGNSKRIPKEEYDKIDKTISVEKQQYVSVTSNESKRRKKIHLGP